MTPKMNRLKSKLNSHKKLTINTSQNINQNPRDNRNIRVSEVVFLEDMKAIDAPERNTNVGAQKCVTQRVKKTGILLSMGSPGSKV